MGSITTDTFFNGNVKIIQAADGYRFSVDAVLLAHHVRPQPGDKVVDLGTGCGIIPLILSYRHPGLEICGVEVQDELAEIALRNVAKNRMGDRINILCRDMKTLSANAVSGPVHVVVSNPPYRETGSGRINPNRQRAVAKHEFEVTLYDIVKTARRMLRPHGKFVTIYPADRLTDIITRMRSLQIEPKLIRAVYPRRDAEAKRILLEGIKDGRQGIRIDPPLIIYRADGSYTDEVLEMFQP